MEKQVRFLVVTTKEQGLVWFGKATSTEAFRNAPIGTERVCQTVRQYFSPSMVIKMFFPEFSTVSWQPNNLDYQLWQHREDWVDKTPKEILEYWASTDDTPHFLGTNKKPSEILKLLHTPA